MQVEIKFRDNALTWYMKYKSTITAWKDKPLTIIKANLLKEFKKPKSESQCITEIKDMKSW